MHKKGKFIKKLKTIPLFKSEIEESDFWDTHDITEYFNMTKTALVSFTNLKKTTKRIKRDNKLHFSYNKTRN